MRDDKALLKFLLLTLGMMILGVASWRIMTYSSHDGNGGLFSSSASFVRGKSQRTSEQQRRSQVSRLKTQEILDSNAVSTAVKQEPSEEQKNVSSMVKSAHPSAWNNFVPREVRDYSRLTAAQPDAPAFEPSRESAAQLAGRPTASAAGSGVQAQTGETAPPASVAGNFSAFSAGRDKERAEMLSSYLKPNREIEDKLNRTLDNLAFNIQSAIDKVIKPQSKKAQNIEKYRQKSSSAAAGATAKSDNPFTDMLAQVAAQGDSIVQNTTKAFGNKAGNEMASLMSEFQRELSAAVNTPNATKAQMAEKVKDVSKKYQEKINKLSEKQQYDKFVQDRIEQDNKQKQELSQFYKGEVMDQLGTILDKAREKELALALQNLPEQEYWNEVLKNNYQMQADMRDTIKKAGAPLDYFNKWMDNKEAERIKQQVKAEEEGLVPSYADVLPEEKLKARQETWKKEKQDLYGQLLNGYGKEGAEEFNEMYREYENKMLNLAKTPMSDAKRLEQEMLLRKEYNDKIAQWQKTPHARQMAVTQGATNVLNSIFEQNPAIARDPQQRAQFEAQSRPVIEQAMAQILDVQNNEKMSPEQKQREIDKIQKDLEHTLSGGQ